MLQGRLRHGPAAITALLILSACAGVDGTERGALRENVIEPGITAIDQSKVLACDGDLTTLRAAAETYELLEGAPPAAEADLVAGEFLRSESELWDIEDGAIVPVDPACGSPATEDPDAIEIVTSTEPPPSPEEVYADLSPEQIEAIGGEQCARQLVDIFSALDRFITDEGRQPDGIVDLEAGGYLAAPVTLWQVVDDELVPADNSGCNDFASG